MLSAVQSSAGSRTTTRTSKSLHARALPLTREPWKRTRLTRSPSASRTRSQIWRATIKSCSVHWITDPSSRTYARRRFGVGAERARRCRDTATARARSSSVIGGNSVSAAAISSISASVHVRRTNSPESGLGIGNSIVLVERAALATPRGAHPDDALQIPTHRVHDRNDQAPGQASDDDAAHLAEVLALPQI